MTDLPASDDVPATRIPDAEVTPAILPDLLPSASRPARRV